MILDFAVEGDQLISRKILRLSDRADDARPAFRAIADQFMRHEEALFDSEGASGGQPWAPLSPFTVESKQREGLGPKILQGSGALRRSLTSRGGDQKLEVGRTYLVFGTNVPYAGYHQRGTSRMPRRRVVQFTEPQKRQAIKILQRFLVTGDV